MSETEMIEEEQVPNPYNMKKPWHKDGQTKPTPKLMNFIMSKMKLFLIIRLPEKLNRPLILLMILTIKKDMTI